MTEMKMTKVHVSIPNHWAAQGESLWATPVEGEPEHYKLENIPFFAYGLAIGDIVRAVSTADHPCEVVEVVRPTGDLTCRVMFTDTVGRERQVEILQKVHEDHGVRMESGFPQYWTMNVPQAAKEAVLTDLRQLREGGVLDMETGDQRVEGSFDADPDQE